MHPSRRRWRRLAPVAVLALAATYLGASALTANAADTLLSQGRPVAASSTQVLSD